MAIHAREGEADVQLGNFRLKLPSKRLELRQKAPKQAKAAIGQQSDIHVPQRGGKSPGMEIDLRGATVNEGLERIEGYLDEAYMSRLPFVRIIHGKGTGVLRDAVRDMMKRHPLVTNYRAGEAGEGGDGVTVVNLVEG
jgi:DNA mismatch repair protein MutS2